MSDTTTPAFLTVELRGDTVTLPEGLADRDDLELVHFTAATVGPSAFDVISDVVHYVAGALGGRGLVWQDDAGLFIFVPKEFVK